MTSNQPRDSRGYAVDPVGALSVACPECGAEPGTSCAWSTWMPHLARVKAQLEAAADPLDQFRPADEDAGGNGP